jgi:hypothetical protein
MCDVTNYAGMVLRRYDAIVKPRRIFCDEECKMLPPLFAEQELGI